MKFENLEKMSKWTRLFSVNGLGYNFCGIFEEEKIIVRISGKTEGQKSSELSVKFENLEKMSKWTRLFQ